MLSLYYLRTLALPPCCTFKSAGFADSSSTDLRDLAIDYLLI